MLEATHKTTHPPRQNNNAVFRVATALIVLMLLAFILASHLAIASIDYTSSETSLAEAVLGNARTALSAKLYTEADVYFHRGVPHIHEKAFDSDIFQQIRQKVSPSRHVHVHGAAGIKEIMPWLELSIKADPQHLESYLVAAFWLAGKARRPDLALKLLAQAQRNIPYSYQTQMEKGRILLHTGDHSGALQAFTAALAFWQKSANKNSKESLFDKARILLYHGLLEEEAGNRTAALNDLRQMAGIHPPAPSMLKRINNLAAGKKTSPNAHDLLASVLQKEDKQRHKCNHHHHHAHGDHDEDEHHE